MAHCTYMPALRHWKPNSSEQWQHKRCSDNSNAESEFAFCPAIFLPLHSILVCWPCVSHLQCTLILPIAFLPFFLRKSYFTYIAHHGPCLLIHSVLQLAFCKVPFDFPFLGFVFILYTYLGIYWDHHVWQGLKHWLKHHLMLNMSSMFSSLFHACRECARVMAETWSWQAQRLRWRSMSLNELWCD